MTMLEIIVLSVLGYIVSTSLAACYAYHTYWRWKKAYRRRKPLTPFAAWHPVVVNRFWRDVPTDKPRDDDLRMLVVLSLAPGFNTVLLVSSGLGCAVGKLLRVLRSALQELPGCHSERT